ncbi:FtsB family cell division protein [Haloglycomyces albus]|uniref:FtsB family cell division protein n=1 Tax=Haloglycomyces albus TaxID=526067 RepID=UPI00146F9631|nr:septum formation initiator family protein [Haloglycomyces albus]
MSSRRPSRPGAGRGGSGPGRSRTGRQRKTTTGTVPAVQRRRVRPPRRMSRRAAVLALVLSLLALAYAYPLRTFVEQRIEINNLEQERARQIESIADLEKERAKWNDDEYVAAQIRERLGLVEPGEELVKVLGEDDNENLPDPDSDTGPEKEWFDDLLDTFDDADSNEPEDADD